MKDSVPSYIEDLRAEPLLESYINVRRYTFRHELFEGTVSAPITREIIEHKQAVAVLLHDPDQDGLVLIEQLRFAARLAGVDPWLTEVVAGTLEANEPQEDACRRECLEETGLAPRVLLPICNWLSSPGICTERIFLWYGQVKTLPTQSVHGLAEEGENIRVTTHSLQDVRNMMESGRIINSITLIALQWFFLYHDRLPEIIAQHKKI